MRKLTAEEPREWRMLDRERGAAVAGVVGEEKA